MRGIKNRTPRAVLAGSDDFRDEDQVGFEDADGWVGQYRGRDDMAGWAIASHRLLVIAHIAAKRRKIATREDIVFKRHIGCGRHAMAEAHRDKREGDQADNGDPADQCTNLHVHRLILSERLHCDKTHCSAIAGHY